MELKSAGNIYQDVRIDVLIVPLWNWNDGYEGMAFCRWTVLIVPLWNWNIYGKDKIDNVNSSNRTFMELKSFIRGFYQPNYKF